MRVQVINDQIAAYGEFISGANVYDIDISDYSPEKYDYTPVTPGVFNPAGFTLKVVAPTINFEKRQTNVSAMNSYMNNFVLAGQLTQANFDLFLSDTAALVQQYLGGGGRLITWIETVNRNGYNASTIGFKTKTAYRGSLVGGLYERAEVILSYLNDL